LPDRRAATVVIVDLAALSAVNCTSVLWASSDWRVCRAVLGISETIHQERCDELDVTALIRIPYSAFPIP
jgi:hypothetical protein